MADFDIEVLGVDKLVRKLSRLGSGAVKPAMAEAGAHIKSVMATYPRRRPSGPQPPKTMKQRVFLIHAIENGLITVPYRRTGGLGRRWTVELRDGGQTAAVGNNAPGAKFVQSEEDQNFYHRTTGWKTDKQAVTEEADEVREILARHIRNWANKSESGS